MSKYKHGNTDDDYSDAFIDNAINSAPKANGSERELRRQEERKNSKARLMSDSERREWAEDIYSDTPEKKKVTCSCGSVTVFAFSFVLLLIGIGIIAFGFVEKKKKLLPLCPKCDDVIKGLYIAGGCVIFVSLFGILAAKLRHKAMAIPFTFFLVLLAIAFLGVGVAAIVYKTGLKSFNLEPVWHDAVVDDHDFICSVQKNLECSGFDHCCFTNATSLDNTTNAVEDVSAQVHLNQLVAAASDGDSKSGSHGFCYITDGNGTKPEWATRQCVSHCSSNSYTKTCEKALRDELNKHMIPFIAVVFPTALIMLIMAVVSIKMTRLKGKYDA